MSTPFPRPKLVSPLDNVLAKRGLTQLDAIAIELTFVTGEQLAEETNVKRPWVDSAQKLPYFDLDGHPVIDPKTGKQFCRYRLENKSDWKFNADFKPQKYAQAKPSSGHITYVPRGVGIDWHKLSADSAEPLMITEGEYKAVAACKMGIAAVGLSGIWMIGGSTRKMTTPLESVNWIERPVVICFDADDSSTIEEPLRPAIELKAAIALANKLKVLGSNPKMVYIAKTPTFLKQEPRVKMGIDDFRDAGGTLDELMETLSEVETEDLALAELLQDWCVCLGSKPFVMDQATGKFKHSAGDFISVVVSNRKVKLPQGDGKFKEMPAGRAFLDVKGDRRPEFRTMAFDPGADFGLDMDRDRFNMWNGLATAPGMKNPDDLDRDVAIWRKYLSGIVGAQWVEYIEKWVAHIVQRPYEKTTIAVVLGGKTEGTGKSLLGAIIGALVGERYRHSGNFEDFFGDYKGANLDSKLLIQIEESEGVSHAKLAKLKDFITNPRINISIKYVPDYTNDNLARVLITSNALDPIKVDETSRRFFVARTPLTQEEVVGGWREWVGREVWERFCLDSSEAGEWPRRHLMYHLLNVVNLAGWEANGTPPVTDEMEDMIEATRDVGELGIIELYGMLNSSEEGWWALPSNVGALNSRLWSKFSDFVKVRGGSSLLLKTRAFGELKDVRIFTRKGYVLPTRTESKGKGAGLKTRVDVVTWDKDAADLMRGRDRLIAAFEVIGPILRLSEDNITAVRRFKAGSVKY